MAHVNQTKSGSAVVGMSLLVSALLTIAACGSPAKESTTITGGGGSSPTGAAGSGTGMAGTTGSPGTAGTTVSTTGAAGTTGANAAVCQTYCTAVQAACTGANAQYKDMANCMKACSFLPAGTPADNSGNSVGCRTNEAASAAKQTTAIKSSCWSAGPLGFGKCGSECDIFCAIATSYCSAAGGYTGTPPYKSLKDCTDTCGLYTHIVDETATGIYSANWMSGGTPETTDTQDCRDYHLIINALQGGANQTAHCPHAAAVSQPCGPGPDLSILQPPPPTDGGTGGDAFVPTPTGDGGYVSIINPTNWSEEKFPFATRRMLLRDEGDPHLCLIDLGAPANNWKTVAGGPWARAAQLIGNNQVLGGRNDGYEVFDLTTGKIVKTVNGFGNTQSAYRMANGETMLTRSGTQLTFLGKDDKMAHQISYPGYGYVRVARPTRNGTFLVPSDTTLFEGDPNGKVLWTAHGSEWGHIWEPLLMKDGNTLICTAFGASCDIVDKTTHMVTKRYGTKKMPNAGMFQPNFFAEYEILPNGNIITSNWQGHGGGNGPKGIQVIEFNPAGDVIWYYKQDPAIFSSIQGVMVLDGKDPKYLHVQETSADSTWQPVIPTP